MNWPEIQALPVVGFLDYLDRTERQRCQKYMEFCYRPAPIEVDEAWQEEMMFLYRQNITAERFVCEGQMLVWIRKGVGINLWRQKRSNNRYRRGAFVQAFISELAENEVGKLMFELAGTPERAAPPQLGQSVGWLRAGLEALSDKEKRILRLSYEGDYTAEELAEELGYSSSGSAKFAKAVAMRKLRSYAGENAIEGDGFVTCTDGHVRIEVA